MRIERHIAGHFTVPAGICRQGDDLERPVVCPIPVYVVETGGERILVDTGPHPAAVAGADDHYGRPGATGPFVLSQEESIAGLVDLSTVTRVVLTHLHFDHAGGLDLVPRGATVVLPKADLEADAEDNNFRAVDYETGHPRIETEGVYDLFGDGAIVLHPTPGHTPGHQSVLVDGDVLIAADACYFPETVDDERLPAYGWDRDAERESLAWIREQRDAGLTVLYGHEPSAGTFQRP